MIVMIEMRIYGSWDLQTQWLKMSSGDCFMIVLNNESKGLQK